MAQVRVGVQLTSGSAVVTSPANLTNYGIDAGYMFMLEGSREAYFVAAAPTWDGTKSTLSLTSPYADTSSGSATGVFAIDYTAPDMIPLIAPGDINTATVFTQAMYRLQELIKAVSPEGFAQMYAWYQAADAAASSATLSATTATASKNAAQNSATAASGSATAAANSATAAASSAAAALSSKNAAETASASASASANTASTKASDAATSATTASSAATTATNQASTATAQATTSTTQANLAKDWATKLTTEVVAGQGYSAKQYAQNAAASVTDALTYASNSQAYANLAKDWATKLGSEVVAGQGYSAKQYASDAATSATSASSSATAANSSKTAAATSETNAATSATSAATAKTAAEAARDKASLWANADQNVEVETGKYSAKHWAMVASGGATGSLVYKGSFNASSNGSPPAPILGHFYKISAAGSVGGTQPVNVGDSIIYNGSGWDVIDNTEAVVSVNGQTGVVTITNITGNAATATKLATARTISLIGDVTGSVGFDGSSAVNMTTSVSAFDWSKITTGKPTTLAGYGITDAQTALGYTAANKAGETFLGGIGAPRIQVMQPGASEAQFFFGNSNVSSFYFASSGDRSALSLCYCDSAGAYAGIAYSVQRSNGALTFGTPATFGSNVTINGSATVVGNFSHSGNYAAIAAGGTMAQVEIGGAATTYSYIDFHSVGGAGNDYDVRIDASGGTAGTSGKGTLGIYANMVSIAGALQAQSGVDMTGGVFRLRNGTQLRIDAEDGSDKWRLGQHGSASNDSFFIYDNARGVTVFNISPTDGAVSTAGAMTVGGSLRSNGGSIQGYQADSASYAAINLYTAGSGGGVWLFKNGSGRAADGGAETATLRNDAGALRLQSNAATVSIGSDGYTVVSGTLQTGNGIIRGITTPTSNNVNTGTSDASLEAQNAGGGAAKISLHRAGAYAIQIGLDTDNVFRVGGWSDGASYRFQADASGNLTARGAITASEVYSNGWLRSVGAQGWFNETYGGGIYMLDTDYIRAYNAKGYHADVGSNVRLAGMFRADDNRSYGKVIQIATNDSTGTDGPQIQFNHDNVVAWGFGVEDSNGTGLATYAGGSTAAWGVKRHVFGYDGNITMRGDTSVTLSMADLDEVTRHLHTNSGSIGFLTSGFSWAFRCDNSGNVIAAGNVTAYSDETVKTNWRGMGENFVDHLALVKSGIYDRTDIGLTQVGVSAQSLRDLMPHAVQEDDEGKLSVAYGNAALASVIELAKEVVALRRRVEELEAA